MKINAINNNFNKYNNINRVQSFKCNAVPYPEYTNSSVKEGSVNIIESIANKVSELFTPKVNKEAAVIKNQINNIYETTPKKALLEVLA